MKTISNQKQEKPDPGTREQDDDKLNIKYQDKEYNESYKQWRRENKDSIGFFYVEKPNSLTYNNDVGFISDSPEIQEEKALHRAVNILGGILIIRSALTIIFTYFLPVLLERIGADIRYDFFDKTLYGDRSFIIILNFILNILSMIIPVGLLAGQLHMPMKVMLPMKITNKPMFRASVPVMLLICGVCSAMSMAYEHLLSALRIDTSRSLYFPDSPAGMIFMIFSEVIIIPAISELCTRGVILQFTRQFGDGTALIITGIITAALCGDITKFCFIFIAAIAIGYFTIRTGSVLTAVAMRITMQFFAYTMYYFDYMRDDNMMLMIIIFISVAIGTIYTIFFLYRHSDCFGININSRYMTYGKKLLTFFTSAPIIIWMTMNFIITVLNVKFLS